MSQRRSHKRNQKIFFTVEDANKHQNVWGASQAVFGGKFITLDAHIRYEEASQVHNLSSYIKKLGKKTNKVLKVCRKEK